MITYRIVRTPFMAPEVGKVESSGEGTRGRSLSLNLISV